MTDQPFKSFRAFQKHIKNRIRVFSDHPSNRVTHASVLLLWHSRPPRRVEHFMELGCGTGFVSFGLSKLFDLNGIGIDNQTEVEEHFNKGIVENGLSGKLTFLPADLREIQKTCNPGITGLVVFNPPYYLEGRGRRSTDETRDRTRAASRDTFLSFFQAAQYLLKNRGYFSTVIDPQLLPETIRILEENHLILKELRPVYGNPERDARLVLLKGIKNARPGFMTFHSPVFLNG